MDDFSAQCNPVYDSPGARGSLADWTEFACRMRDRAECLEAAYRALALGILESTHALEQATYKAEELLAGIPTWRG